VKAVIDTNVIAYYLLGTKPFADEAGRFWRAVREPVAPALWEAELANVIWMATRAGVLPSSHAVERLELAVALGLQSVPNRNLWHGALVRAIQSGVAVYDTLFVELAIREHLPLATFDKKLLSAFPRIAKRPSAIVSA